MASETVAARKAAATEFLRMAAIGRVREAYERYISPGFRHHNVYFPGDRESLLKGMEEAAARQPGKTLEVKRVIAEGDLVAVHSHLRVPGMEPGIAVVHIARFEGERIAEMWDVGQVIPKESPNQNGAF